MDNKEIRLRIVEAVVPISSRVSLVGEDIIKVCSNLEQFVVNNKEDEKDEQSPSSPVKKTGRPKRTTDKVSSTVSDPMQ